MSRRRPALQLDGQSSGQYRGGGTDDMFMDDDALGNMPTPERLVPTDIPVPEDRGDDRPARRDNFNIDNKVANFLAEIDALDPADENSRSPAPPYNHDREEDPGSSIRPSPPRERSESPQARHKPGAYSMFVKGKSEFMGKREEKTKPRERGRENVWPEEPRTEWKQLKDEQSNYPYYWHTEKNDVVWEMPSEFSQYLTIHKEYEETVERGLKDGTLNPAHRPQSRDDKRDRGPSSMKNHKNKPTSKKRDYSDDSGSVSRSDSDSGRSSHSSTKGKKAGKGDKRSEVPSSTTARAVADGTSKDRDNKPKKARVDPSDLQEEAAPQGKVSPPASTNDDSMDFDDIDKELELALERKRQELLRLETGDTPGKDAGKPRPKDKDRDSKHDAHRRKGQADERKYDRHRRHDDRRDDRRKDDRRHGDREKDGDRDRKSEKELRQARLTLKDRLKIEMELKMEKEKRKKKQIEEMMAKELEKTVGSSKGHKRSHRDRDNLDEPRKRYRDEDSGASRPRDDYDTRTADDYRHDYSVWGRESRGMYDDPYEGPQHKPPPPTQEMIDSVSERRSKVVDYAHGRSAEHNGDSDNEDKRSADVRDLEMKKLEALQLAELALSKLEFLEVTKKGLSKLQILLIELETRHQDWQSGGLTTNHFLGKLREANWQLEQYEDSAAPPGWMCHWDRDYRRYFYTHKVTSRTQWEYPNPGDGEDGGDGKDAEISSTTGDRKHTDTASKSKKSVASEILTSASLPPPPPPPVEEHPLVRTLQLQYGSTSGSESDDEEKRLKETKKKEDELIPLPPSAPPSKEMPADREKPPEREKKEKHKKKKKKEKSKKKDKEKADQNVPVGPMLPPGPPLDPTTTLDGQPISYTSSEIDGVPISYMGDPEIDGQPMDYGGEGGVGDAGQMLGVYDVSYDPAVNAPLSAEGMTAQVPVYGQQPDAEQNDQPLAFNTAGPDNGAPPGLDQPEGLHPELEYPDPYSVVSGDPGIQLGAEGLDPATEPPLWPPPGTDEKKKKKEKKEKMSGVNIALKKKHVSSLVQKWQKVKKEVEQEERHREERDSEIRRKLEEWKQDGFS